LIQDWIALQRSFESQEPNQNGCCNWNEQSGQNQDWNVAEALNSPAGAKRENHGSDACTGS
jgi:hypothetical protein